MRDSRGWRKQLSHLTQVSSGLENSFTVRADLLLGVVCRSCRSLTQDAQSQLVYFNLTITLSWLSDSPLADPEELLLKVLPLKTRTHTHTHTHTHTQTHTHSPFHKETTGSTGLNCVFHPDWEDLKDHLWFGYRWSLLSIICIHFVHICFYES